MTEELYVLHSFKTHFESYKYKKIVLYGKGPKTSLIINAFPDYNIVGIMDRQIESGEMYGKSVISLQQAIAWKVDMIVVVARPQNIRKVYNRIGELCRDNGILLYGINGKNLFEYYGIGGFFYINSDSDILEERKIYEAIDSHSTISFSIMDTLIMRKTLLYEDLLEVLCKQLEKENGSMEALKRIRISLNKRAYKYNWTIDQIYTELAKRLKLSEEQVDKIKTKELELEQALCIPRKKMLDIFQYAKDKKKRIFLIEDTYLPKDFLCQILEKAGVNGYEEILLSCEQRRKKEDSLFDLLQSTVGQEKILHVGCNQMLDGERAQSKGFDVYQISSALDMLNVSLYKDMQIKAGSINERSMMGLWVSRMFNNPFSLYRTGGRAVVNRLEDMAYLYVAPLISTFILWLVRTVKENSWDDLLFAARDGFLLQRLYHKALEKFKLTDIPKGIYFYTSRRVCAGAAIKEERDIKWLADIPCYYSMEELIRDRFEIKERDIIPFNRVRYESAFEYAMAHREKIYDQSKQTRLNYFKYMNYKGLKIGGNYAFIDFCSIGTCQWFLDNIVPFQLTGLYFCKYFNETNMVNNVKVKSLFQNLSPYACDSYFYEHYLFLETVMTSQEPSLFSIDGEGKPVFAKEERTEDQKEAVENMQAEIERYFNEYLEMYIDTEPLDPEYSDMLYSFMGEGYAKIESRELKELILEDGLGRGPIKVAQQ